MTDLIRQEPPRVTQPEPARTVSPVVFPRRSEQSGLHHSLRVLSERKWLVAAVILTVVSAVALESFTAVPVYRASTQIQIDPEPVNVLPYQDIYEPTQSYVQSLHYLQTQQKILLSRVLARRVIQKLNLAADPVFNASYSKGLFREAAERLARYLVSMARNKNPEVAPDASSQEAEAVDRLTAHLEVNLIPDSRLVELAFSWPDPQFAARVVDSYSVEFIEQNFEAKYDATTKATQFLQKQLTDLKIKVESSEEHLIQYARSHNILTMGERENMVLQNLEDLSRERSRVQADLIAKTAEFDSVRRSSTESFPQSLQTELIDQLQKQQFEAQQKLAALSTRFGPEWPDIIEVKRQLAELDQQLRREKQRLIDQSRRDYEVALSRYQKLSSAVDEQKGLAERLNEDSIQYNILKREVESNKQLYEALLQRLKQASIAAGLKSSNIRVADPPEVPRYPDQPKPLQNLIFALALGTMLGVGVVFLVDQLDQTIKSPEQVQEHLGLPSLGFIPTFRLNKPSSLLSLPGAAREEGRMIPLPNGRMRNGYSYAGGAWESYRALRTSILLSHSGKPPQMILMTSALPGEGKTTTAYHTSIALALTGAHTLVVDLDMRKPSLADHFGLDNRRGMSTFLSGNCDLASVVQPTNIPNLFLLAAGPCPPNPPELIGSERMSDAIHLLRRFFRHVVVDTPPLLTFTDGLVLSPRADGVVLIVHGGKTSRDLVRKAQDHLAGVGARILGVAINNIEMHRQDYGYYRKYYGGGEQPAWIEPAADARQGGTDRL